jgi:hypothetical protein
MQTYSNLVKKLGKKFSSQSRGENIASTTLRYLNPAHKKLNPKILLQEAGRTIYLPAYQSTLILSRKFSTHNQKQLDETDNIAKIVNSLFTSIEKLMINNNDKKLLYDIRNKFESQLSKEIDKLKNDTAKTIIEVNTKRETRDLIPANNLMQNLKSSIKISLNDFMENTVERLDQCVFDKEFLEFYFSLNKFSDLIMHYREKSKSYPGVIDEKNLLYLTLKTLHYLSIDRKDEIMVVEIRKKIIENIYRLLYEAENYWPLTESYEKKNQKQINNIRLLANLTLNNYKIEFKELNKYLYENIAHPRRRYLTYFCSYIIKNANYINKFIEQKLPFYLWPPNVLALLHQVWQLAKEDIVIDQVLQDTFNHIGNGLIEETINLINAKKMSEKLGKSEIDRFKSLYKTFKQEINDPNFQINLAQRIEELNN